MFYFNPLKIKLKNSNLIEASAGTGKTNIISILYLRFLLGINLQKNFSSLHFNKLLIVTFTDLATLEIKNRIRINIKNLRISCKNNVCLNDEIKYLFDEVKNIPNIINILFLYEYQIDIFSIFTIHGFCKKILFTNFFSSNLNLSFNILNSESDLIYNLVVFFWKKYFNPLSVSLIKIIITYWLNPKDLFKYILPFFNYITFDFNYINNYLSINDCYCKIINFINKVKKQWNLENKNIYHLLMSLNLNKYVYNKKNISNWVKKLSIWSNTITVNFLYPDCLLRFSGKYLFNCSNGNVLFLRKDSFFSFVDNLFLIKNDLFNFILVLCFNYVKKELKKKKINKSLLSFNDLILYLYKSLNKDVNNVLVDSIKSSYPVILIDEFQDTDFLQYEIFYKIYINNDSNLETKLILIGDVKQLIYTFRGASVYIYIKARNDVNCLYTFNDNWRSSFNLIESINYLFCRLKNVFFFKDIKYIPVNYSKKSKLLKIIRKDKIDYSINFFVFKKKLINLNYKQVLAKYCAISVCKLLDESKNNFIYFSNKKQKKKIVPSDISILVYSNLETKIIFDEFSKLNLPIVNNSVNSNVFSTLEAKEVMFVLKSILFPESELNMRNALSTSIFGFDLFSISKYLSDKNKLYLLIEEFHCYYNILINDGFFSMIKFIIYKKNLINRLCDNKQYIINLIHISEILQKIYLDLKNEKFLLDWLNEKINSFELNIPEYSIRSYYDDNNAIKVTTIHKSKGLQYNIVYIPFLINLRKKDKYYVFYDLKKNNVNVDLLKSKKNRKLFKKELISEEMRLLYVAITRSVYQCNLFVYENKKYRNLSKFYLSSIGKIFFFNKKKDFNDIKKILFNNFNCKYINFIFIKDINKKVIFYFNNEDDFNKEIINIKKKKFNFNFKNKGLFNYTNIVNKNDKYFLKYIDFNKEKNDFNNEKKNIHYFPKGENIGNFFHILLENMDFNKDINVDFISKKLIEFNYDNNWLNIIKNSLFNVLNVKLDFINISISSDKIVFLFKEFDFLLFIKKSFSFSNYNKIIKKYDFISKFCNDIFVSFDLLNGYLNGVIDLIFLYKEKFYIVDYKSNWLGYSYSDYNKNNLLKIMSFNRYDIQYQIYSLVLHNYLKLNLLNYSYNKNFGGIYYIFIRGLFLNKYNKTENGIFFVKPNNVLINKLSILICGK